MIERNLYLGAAIGLIIGSIVFLVVHFAFPTSCPAPELITDTVYIITDFCYKVTSGVDEFTACLIEYGLE